MVLILQRKSGKQLSDEKDCSNISAVDTQSNMQVANATPIFLLVSISPSSSMKVKIYHSFPQGQTVVITNCFVDFFLF